MIHQKKNFLYFLLFISLIFNSCTGAGPGFTPGKIAVFITAAFVVGVIFYFLIRSQRKRKGDDNRKP